MKKYFFIIFCFVLVIVSFYFYFGTIREKTSEKANSLRSVRELASLKKAAAKYETDLQEALQAINGKYNALLYLSVRLAEAGSYSDCVQRLLEAKSLKANDPSLYYYLGLCYSNLARTALAEQEKEMFIKEAKQSYMLGLRLRSDDELLHYGLGILYGFVEENLAEAEKHLLLSYEKEPYDVNVIFALANISFQQDKISLARHYYLEIMDKAVKNTPKWKQAEENLRNLGSDRKAE